ncbi:hypothetical protein [Stenotrophomonas terrae]|uniref:hypothetical protein n=1 Tax=Stenotrophomonas terrae TaxID=405446 RepID=UPI003D359D37
MRYGYQCIHILLRREGWLINRKRVHRLYKLAGPNLRSKQSRRRRAAVKELVFWRRYECDIGGSDGRA